MKKVFNYAIALAGGVIFFMVLQWLDNRGLGIDRLLPEGSGIYLLVLLPILYLFVLAVHEMGHLLGGYSQQFDFYKLTFGPLTWKLGSEGRIRFRWEKSFKFDSYMIPAGEDNMRRRFLWLTAGGPLASLVLSILFFLLAQLPNWGFLSFTAYAISVLSLLVFVLNMLPFRIGGIETDGLRLINYASNDINAAGDLTRMRALAHVRAGKPYGELPEAALRAVAFNENIHEGLRVVIDYFRYLFAVGVGDLAEANKLLESVITRINVYPVVAHGNFYLEQALFSAKYLKDLPAAEAALKKVKKEHSTEPLSIHLAEAAIAELKGDMTALALELSGIEMYLAWNIDQSLIPIVQKWLSEWKGMVRKAS